MSCGIIHKDNKVPVTMKRFDRHGTMQITVNNLKRSLASGGCLGNDPVLLTSKAWLTDRVR